MTLFADFAAFVYRAASLSHQFSIPPSYSSPQSPPCCPSLDPASFRSIRAFFLARLAAPTYRLHTSLPGAFCTPLQCCPFLFPLANVAPQRFPLVRLEPELCNRRCAGFFDGILSGAVFGCFFHGVPLSLASGDKFQEELICAKPKCFPFTSPDLNIYAVEVVTRSDLRNKPLLFRNAWILHKESFPIRTRTSRV